MTETVAGGAILDRAVQIVNFVASAGRAVTVPEIIDALKLPRPTVHRICGTLESMGLLARDLAPNRLVPGPALVKLAGATLASTGAALPRRKILRRVVDEVFETATLTVLDHDELLFLDRVESSSPLRVQLFAGSRTPLHCTSAGKLFMAMQPAARRRRLLSVSTFAHFTNNTITDLHQLQKELEKIRKAKVSIDHEEYIDGLIGIAVPVLDAQGRMVAAVSVNGPSNRVRLDNVAHYVEALRKAADDLRSCLSDTESLVGGQGLYSSSPDQREVDVPQTKRRA